MSEHAPLSIMFSAGESSGDQHAANLFLELKKRRSDIKGFGMGGTKMAQAGVDINYRPATVRFISRN